MAVCDIPGCTEHYGCRLKSKGINASNALKSTRTLNLRPTPSIPPAHYRNVLTEERPGGFRMPIIKEDGSVIRHREAQAKEAKIKRDLERTRATVAKQGA